MVIRDKPVIVVTCLVLSNCMIAFDAGALLIPERSTLAARRMNHMNRESHFLQIRQVSR
jgi:hypothetical protein